MENSNTRVCVREEISTAATAAGLLCVLNCVLLQRGNKSHGTSCDHMEAAAASPSQKKKDIQLQHLGCCLFTVRHSEAQTTANPTNRVPIQPGGGGVSGVDEWKKKKCFTVKRVCGLF